MKTTEKLNSTLKQHYWEDSGVYQKIYDNLYNELVPASDMAETIHGELIRCISRLYYDFCNNGNCNVLDNEMENCEYCDGYGYEEDADGEEQDCSYCDGECRVDGDLYVIDYYDDMLSFLEINMTERDLAKDLRSWLLNEYQTRYSFSDEQMNVYDKVVDSIVYQCLTTANKPNPLFITEEA